MLSNINQVSKYSRVMHPNHPHHCGTNHWTWTCDFQLELSVHCPAPEHSFSVICFFLACVSVAWCSVSEG